MRTNLKKFIQAVFSTVVFLSAFSQAEAKEFLEVEKFEPNIWPTGIHLIAGFGGNSSLYKSETQPDVVGGGMNLHTDVGYFFGNDYAFELSTSVMFNQVKGLLIWDTVGLVGFRYRIKGLSRDENQSYYGRILAGPSVSVIIGDIPPEQDIGGDRSHIQGQAVGFGFGSFQKATSGNIWFMEVMGIVHDYRSVEAVTVVEEVPVVVNSMDINDNSRLYYLTLTFGVVAF